MVAEFPTLVSVLKKDGYSVTKPRQAVFAALSIHESLDMADLVGIVGSEVDRASVYRTIELFERLDIVNRMQIGWKYRLELSDLFRPHHHHASCQQCGRDFAIVEDKVLEDSILEVGNRIGFKVYSHALEVHGLCQNCQYPDKT